MKKIYLVKVVFTKYYLTDGCKEETVMKTNNKKDAESEVKRINKNGFDYAWIEEK